MDDEKQTNELLSNPNHEPTFTPPAPGARVGSEDGAQMQPPKKSNKKNLFVSFLAILLLAGVAAAAYLLYFKKDAAAPEPQAQQNQQEPQIGGPSAVIFVQSKTADTQGPLELKTLSISDKKISTGYDLSKFESSVLESAVHGNQVAIAVNGSADKPAPATVLYSQDSGKSYKSIWSGKTSTSSELGDQITSITFSSNGSSLVIGHLPEPAGQNQITEISLQDQNTTSVLTTIQDAGAFIYGYDKTSGQVIYSSGCYNCGGSTIQKLSIYNTKSKQISTLVESEQAIASDIFANGAFDKVIYSERSIEEGATASDTVVKEVVLSDKKTETLFTKPKNDPQIIQLGYMADGFTPYYVTEKSIVSLQSDKQTNLFTTERSILDVLYASEDELVVQIGEPEGDFTISKFTIANKELSQILEGGAPAYRLIGVAANN